MENMENIAKLDAIQEPEWMSSTFQETSEGYLKGRAILTNIGVFVYQDGQGKETRDLRLPEEVFSKETLDSLNMLPITLNHPSEMVDSENIKKYQVGHSGNTPSSIRNPEWRDLLTSDGLHVSNEIVITNLDAVQEVKKGKRGLSCGYTCDLEMAEQGAKWCGVPYDFIQRNIRYNHIAVVDKGRAGDAARIRLDSVETKKNSYEEGHMDLKTIKLDGVEYQAEAEVIKTINSLQNRLDDASAKITALNTNLSTIEAVRDTLKEANAELQEKNDSLHASKLDESQIQERVNSLVRVQRVAEHLGVEIKDNVPEIDLMKATVLAKFPKADFEGKDEVYVRARFDSVAESIEFDSDEQTRIVAQVSVIKDKDQVVNADEARKRMIKERMDSSRADLSK